MGPKERRKAQERDWQTIDEELLPPEKPFDYPQSKNVEIPKMYMDELVKTRARSTLPAAMELVDEDEDVTFEHYAPKNSTLKQYQDGGRSSMNADKKTSSNLESKIGFSSINT